MRDREALPINREIDVGPALAEARRRARAVVPSDLAPRIVIVEPRRLIREAIMIIAESRASCRVVGEIASTEGALELIVDAQADAAIVSVESPGCTVLQLASQLAGVQRAARRTHADPGLPARTGVVVVGPDQPPPWLAALPRDSAIRAYVTFGDEPCALVTAIRAACEHGALCSGLHLSPVARLHQEEARQAAIITRETSRSIESLSPRELEVLVQLARGLAIKQVAALLGISAKTVDNHAQHLMAKLDVHSRAELVRLAIRERLLTA